MKTLLASAFFLLSILSFGQSGYQIADTTKTWNTLQYGWASWGVWGCGGTTTTRLADQYIPGDQYLTVFECEDSLLQVWHNVGFIWEDTITKQVFFNDGEEEGLIYDFSLEVGDTVQLENYYIDHDISPLVCGSIDQVNINGETKNRFYLFNALYPMDPYNPNEIWIEGIGSNYGILYSGFGVAGGSGGTVSMLCCSQYGNTIYMDSLFNKCYYDTFYPQIIQDKFDTAFLNTYYEFQVMVDAGDALSFELIGDVIPEGFSFDASTGLLSGTPSEIGAFTCIITVKNFELNALTDIIYEDIMVVLPTATAGPERPQGLKIYPNPFSAILNVDIQLAAKNRYFLELYSTEGKQLQKFSFSEIANFDLSNLRNGLYLIKITDNDGNVLLVESVLKQ